MKMQRKLAAIADADDCDGGDGVQERGVLQLPKDVAPTALMQRVVAAGGGTGMHFAGIPMTVDGGEGHHGGHGNFLLVLLDAVLRVFVRQPV
jgi:hypothetical protein